MERARIEATENREGAMEYPVPLAAAFAYYDEMARILFEVNRLSQDYTSLRRYRIIGVVRNDIPASVWQDLGPADSFIGADGKMLKEFHIPCVAPLDERGHRWEMVLTVGEAVNIANELHAKPEKLEAPEEIRDVLGLDSGKMDLWDQLLDEMDMKERALLGTRTHGSKGAVNGNS